MTITLEAWREVVLLDYLDSFIAQGGSAVKIAVTSGEAGAVTAALTDGAASRGYLIAAVSAADVRVDRIDKLFCDIARQVDWKELAHAVRLTGLAELGLQLPAPGAPFTFDALAAANGQTESMIRNAFNRWLTSNVFKDYRMSQDFRKAMTWLCFGALDSAAPTTETDNNIVDWLTGDLRLLSAVKAQRIYQKVARHNARDLLVSLGHWTRVAGKSGLVIVCDISAAVSGVMPYESAVRNYTRAALMDLYEVLRQCIDATDELESTFLAAVTGPAFLNDARRSVEIYRALQMRVVEEVRDRERDNPLATLVQLA